MAQIIEMGSNVNFAGLMFVIEFLACFVYCEDLTSIELVNIIAIYRAWAMPLERKLPQHPISWPG